jgi:hypothetical protein
MHLTAWEDNAGGIMKKDHFFLLVTGTFAGGEGS